MAPSKLDGYKCPKCGAHLQIRTPRCRNCNTFLKWQDKGRFELEVSVNEDKLERMRTMAWWHLCKTIVVPLGSIALCMYTWTEEEAFSVAAQVLLSLLVIIVFMLITGLGFPRKMSIEIGNDRYGRALLHWIVAATVSVLIICTVFWVTQWILLQFMGVAVATMLSTLLASGIAWATLKK